jgi:RNA polymerase sigma-70 factor (ECF subfamily)
MDEEATLLVRARQFDEQALAEVYDRYSPPLYAYAMRLTGDANTADECVAEVFSRFLAALRRGIGPTDLYRRARPETTLDPELRAGEALEPHTQAAQNLEHRQVRAALGLLTPEQRQVIALKYLEELDNTEIADALQKPVGAVKALQHRALASLRRILAPQMGEEFLGGPRPGNVAAGGSSLDIR